MDNNQTAISKMITATVRCPVLLKNMNLYSEKLMSFASATRDEDLTLEKIQHAQQNLSQDISFTNLGIFANSSFSLCEKYKVEKPIRERFVEFIEYYAFLYLSFYSAKMVKLKLETIDNDLEKMNRAVDRLAKLIRLKEGSTLAALELSNGAKETPIEYRSKVDALLSSLDDFRSIRADFRAAPICVAAQFKNQTPQVNPGLYDWAVKMQSMWTDGLGRSFENTYDGVNGRKNLLELMSDCIVLIDPSIEFSTLDNSLRKVQSESGAGGQLVALNNSVTASSPSEGS